MLAFGFRGSTTQKGAGASGGEGNEHYELEQHACAKCLILDGMHGFCKHGWRKLDINWDEIDVDTEVPVSGVLTKLKRQFDTV